MAVLMSWGDVRACCKKHFGLIPKLESIAKIGAAHENKIFEEIVQACNAAVAVRAGNVQGAAQAHGALSDTLKCWLVVAKDFPELKTSQGFIEWQSALQNTEAALEKAGSNYNTVVKNYNTAIQQFPNALFASFAGYKARELYEMHHLERRT